MVYKINITPQTRITATQRDKIFFRIPREKLHKKGLERLLRLEKYNQYKVDLLSICKVKGFELPSQGLIVRFFVPMPVTWRQWKRDLMHMKLHQDRPDIDNFLKAVFDSLTGEDKYVGHLAGISKQWVDAEKGWIEFETTTPVFDEMISFKTKREYRAFGLMS